MEHGHPKVGAAAVVNVQVSAAPSSLPAASATDAATVTVYWVLGARAPVGSSVAVTPV